MPAAQGYIGRNPADSSTVIARQSFSPTGIQTDFTFAAGYSVGYVDLYLNGARLIEGQDFTATDGSTVGLTTNAVNGDVLEVVAFKAFNATNVTASGGNFTVGQNLTVSGTAEVTGAITATGGVVGDATGLSGTPDITVRHLKATGISTVSDTTQSTTTTSGALIVSGGVGVAKNLFVGGSMNVAGTLTYEDVTNSETPGITTTGGLVVTGLGATFGSGVGIADSIYHIDDSNTAIRFPAADNFSVTTGGSEGLRVDSSQNVGIAGTTIPRAKFDFGPGTGNGILNQTVANYQAVFESPQGTGNIARNIAFAVGNNGINAAINAVDTGGSDATGLIFATGTAGSIAERLRILSDGKVGIASDNPQKTLDVGGDVKIVENSPRLEFHDANASSLSNTTGGFETFDRSGNRATYVGAGMENGGNIIEFGTNNTFRAIINSSGNVGINTASPDRQLHVFSTNGTVAHFESGNANEISQIVFEGLDASAPPNLGATGEHLHFTTNNIERVRIHQNGNVGIATTNPLGKLSLLADDSQDDPDIVFQASAGIGLAHAALSTTDDSGGADLMVGSNFYLSTNGAETRFNTGRSGSAVRFGYSGTMRFYTNSGSNAPTERLRITSAGRVGIGTDDPQAFLVIQGDSNDSTLPSIRLQDGTDARQVQITNTSGDFLVKTCGSDNNTHGSFKIFESGIITLNNGGASGSNTERLRIDVNGNFIFKNGALIENGFYDSGGGITGDYNHDLGTYGNVHYAATNAAGSFTYNLRINSSTTLNSVMAAGDTLSMTLISANNNTSNYMTAFKIDGTTITPEWAGGSGPSAATGSGFDVYSFTCIKIGDASFKVFASFTNHD